MHLAWTGLDWSWRWQLCPSSLRRMVFTFRGDISLMTSWIGVVSHSVRLAVPSLLFIFLDSTVFSSAAAAPEKCSYMSRELMHLMETPWMSQRFGRCNWNGIPCKALASFELNLPHFAEPLTSDPPSGSFAFKAGE